MKIQQQINDKLRQQLAPQYLEVVNESNSHNVPEGSESHFKVTIVADVFADKRLIQRHRLVNKVLANELADDIHALALHTYTAVEWSEKFGQVPDSPQCLGGSKG
jgi:BolA protein